MAPSDRKLPRRRIAVGNWKMHKTVPESVSFARSLAATVSHQKSVEVWIAPTFTALYPVTEALRGTSVGVAAQNLFWEERGAYTGEVSPAQLLDIGVRAALIGHSERRKYFGETDAAVAKKVRAAVDHRLIPILCIGETLDQRSSGRTESVIVSQIEGGLSELPAGRGGGLVISYEPVWAIGTGRVASPKQIAEAHRLIRSRISVILGPEASGVPILYGGSVTTGNIRDLAPIEELDGVLVGGASLESGPFIEIVKALGEGQGRA